MSRTLRPRQRAELYVVDVETAETRLVHTSKKIPVESPTWARDGRSLVVGGDGTTYRVALADGPDAGDRADGGGGRGGLTEIPLGGVPATTGAHVVSPDGGTLFVTAADGHIYAAPAEGGMGRRVTNDHGGRFEHVVHGVSPDGRVLSYIGVKTKKDGRVQTDVFTIPAAGGEDVRMTDDQIPDRGAEFSPDGAWVYFSSERASDRPGHSQLFRMALDRVVCEQLTDDKRVNWFPHPSPDGKRVAYLSYPKRTKGNPADGEVIIRLLEPDGSKRDLVPLVGGPGTLNAPCWSPDGTKLAYVAYPSKE